jgi:hypothetical protein
MSYDMKYCETRRGKFQFVQNAQLAAVATSYAFQHDLRVREHGNYKSGHVSCASGMQELAARGAWNYWMVAEILHQKGCIGMGRYSTMVEG